MHGPEVRRTEVDGIPAFSVDGPRPFTAMLQFRVGRFDEEMRSRGITHLVEHLALFSHRGTEIAYNGTVGHTLTTFWAQGHPDDVGVFLRDVAQSIHQLPFERLGVETEVLGREMADVHASHLDRLLWAYFGPFGPGLAPGYEPALAWVGETEIKHWAQRHFTLGNAALVIVGNPPDSWGIELPPGEPVRYRLPELSRQAPTKPTLFDRADGGVTWAALGKDRKGAAEPALSVGLEVLSRRLEERLRHDLGQTYSVFQGFERLDEDHRITFHGFEAHPEQSRESATEHQKVLKEFVENGPTQDEIDRFNRVQTRAFEDRPLEFAHHHVTDLAETHLQGWEATVDYDVWRANCESVSAEEVRTRFEELYRQSYTISDLEEPTLASLGDIIPLAQEAMRGVDFRFRGFRVQEGYPAAIRVGAEGISLQWSDGWMHEEIDDIAMVSISDGELAIDASYTSITVHMKKYRVSKQGDPAFLLGSRRTLESALRKFLPETLFLPPPRDSSQTSE